MTKKTDDELGVLITREIKSMMMDASISYENRAKMFCSIVGDEKLKDKMMSSFASSLKSGYVYINEKRKAEIYSRRERQRNYQKHIRTSTNISVDEQTSTDISKDRRASLNRIEQNRIDNIPLNPPEGVEGEIPPEVSPEDIIAGKRGGKKKSAAKKVDQTVIKEVAAWTADVIVQRTEVLRHLMTNRGKLMKSLVSVLKKNSARDLEEVAQEILLGLNKWVETWKADDWRYAPGTLTDWIYNEKWREEPRKPKEKPKVEDCVGTVGVEIV